MGLKFDQRSAVGHDAPGCHALIVGVSGYPHLANPYAVELNLQSLSSAALSAHAIYRWLLDAKLAVPLASVRLLLSPAEGESFEDGADPATVEAFIRDASEWRQDASKHPDSMTFFYFAGQGFSLTRGEQVLVFQNFGDGVGPALRSTVSINNLLYGMVPVLSPNIARRQLYFIDTNRNHPSALERYPSVIPSAVFDTSLGGIDDRTTVVFYAAAPNSAAYAYRGQQTFFSRALIDCLEGAASELVNEQGKWGVSIRSLARELPVLVAERAAKAGVTQLVAVEGSLREGVITYFPEPPLADISVEIEPAEAAATATVRIMNDEGQAVKEWAPGSARTTRIPAGLYFVDVRGELAGTSFKKRKVFNISPPATSVRIQV